MTRDLVTKPAQRTFRSLALRYGLMVVPLAMLLPAWAATDAVFVDGFELTVDPCAHPLIAPEGWATQSSLWVDAWSSPDGSPIANYPNSVGFPVPIGANKGQLFVISFTPTANLTVDMTWDTVQANLEQGYYPRPAQSMFFSISSCPADVRPPDNSSADPFLHDGCRRIAGASSMFYTTRADGSSSQFVCHLEAGQQYFMTVAPIDPSNGLQLGEHTCEAVTYSEQGCEVQAVHRGYYN